MCTPTSPGSRDPSSNVVPLRPGARGALVPDEAAARGSRRRRLWELPHHAHCPVVGVCVSIDELRRRLERLFSGRFEGEDYEIHVGTVQQCTTRNPLSELLQRVLDERFAATLRLFAKAQDAVALAALWHATLDDGDLAAALWATLTHARCDAALEKLVLRQVHMIQHQAGASARADARALQALAEENATLARELGRAQERGTRLQSERGAERDTLQAQLVRLRAEGIVKDTVIAGLRAQLEEERDAAADRPSREALVARVDDLTRQVRIAGRERDAARAALAALRYRTPVPLAALAAEADAATGPESDPADEAPAVPGKRKLPDLSARQVLCVGGQHRQIPIYRELVERGGGRFAHHDGGIEDSAQRLDASLAAADLVICQAGCISHNAYWLVKDHCKRTGKRCIYLDKPSVASFARGLAEAASPSG